MLVLPQQALEDAFVKRLGEMKVKVLWSHRLAKLEAGTDKATAHIDKLIKEASGYAYSATGWVVDKRIETRTDFVIGADGLRSTVRRDLDIEFPELGARQFFGVFEFDAAISGANEVRVVLDDSSLDTYASERRREWRTLLGLEEAVKAGAGASDWVRRRSARILP